jgi:hypothetical protein
VHACNESTELYVGLCVCGGRSAPRPIPGNFQETTGNCLGIARLACAPEKRQHAKAGLSFIDAVTVHPASLVWPVTAGLVPFQLLLPRLAPRLHLGTVQQCCLGGDTARHSEHPVVHWQVLPGHTVLPVS